MRSDYPSDSQRTLRKRGDGARRESITPYREGSKPRTKFVLCLVAGLVVLALCGLESPRLHTLLTYRSHHAPRHLPAHQRPSPHPRQVTPTQAPVRGQVTALSFSPDERLIAAGTELGTVTVWSVLSGRVVLSAKPYPGLVSVLRFSLDGRYLASGVWPEEEDNRPSPIFLWDLRSRQLAAVLRGHLNGVSDLVFGLDGHTLMSAGRDGSVRVWNLFTRTGRTVSSEHGICYQLALSPDGRRLAVACNDTSAIALRLPSGKPVAAMKGLSQEEVWTVAWSPDGRTLATGARDYTLRLWDTRTWRTCRRIHVEECKGVEVLAFSPDGRTLCTGSDLWDVRTGRRLSRVGGRSWILQAQFLPDGRDMLAWGRMDRGVRLWQVRNGKLLHEFGPGSMPFALSVDGKMLATAPEDPEISSDDHIRVWEMRTAKLLAALS
ncbi:MAG TPA: WD40 repeat domain-containing protein [Armatimonadota bacterium]|nr:WD40 repeat domain-containing protein [Armatimonadota bacterium]